jgi:hypothetical protein
MRTECNPESFNFQPLGRRQVIGRFDGGEITSDGGALLLRELEQATGLLKSFTECFVDHREQRRVRHGLYELIAQRLYALVLGYEDLVDHDELRWDQLLSLLVGLRDQEQPLAGKSTLNRLELGCDGADRYKKITVDEAALERFFVRMYLRLHREPERLILDLDATDDAIHGDQEGRFFHGYYKSYCYLPLYVFTEDGFPLWAELRRSNIDACEGAVEAVSVLTEEIRQCWPEVPILLRADSGFAREELMAWCEKNRTDYVFGLAKNSRLKSEIQAELAEAQQEFEVTGQSARRFRDFTYRTLKSWSRSRRVVGKAEYLAKGSNPRFVVTSLDSEVWAARELYEQLYCQRGEMENRIKEQQLDLFADRTSSSTMRANQLRLWFSTTAYSLLHLMRRLGLKDTRWARAQCGTIRLKLLKIGACITVSVRRVLFSMASGYPYQSLFAQVYANLQRAGPF